MGIKMKKQFTLDGGERKKARRQPACIGPIRKNSGEIKTWERAGQGRACSDM